MEKPCRSARRGLFSLQRPDNGIVSLKSDGGSVTVEAALVMSVLVMVAAAIIAGVITVAGYLQVVHTAGAAARAHAIGVAFTPPRGTVEISESSGIGTATAHLSTPLGELSADAVFPLETQ